MSRFLDALPRLVIEEQIERLVRAFGAKPTALEGFAGELTRATQGWHQPEFVAAIDAAIRSERTFPRIATILKHRPEAERRSVTVGHPHTCRQCGIDSYLAGYETADGRLFGRYRCGCEPAHQAGTRHARRHGPIHVARPRPDSRTRKQGRSSGGATG